MHQLNQKKKKKTLGVLPTLSTLHVISHMYVLIHTRLGVSYIFKFQSLHLIHMIRYIPKRSSLHPIFKPAAARRGDPRVWKRSRGKIKKAVGYLHTLHIYTDTYIYNVNTTHPASVSASTYPPLFSQNTLNLNLSLAVSLSLSRTFFSPKLCVNKPSPPFLTNTPGRAS